MTAPEDPVDLFVIGGGINGCGIARDAAGRGLSVTLAERDDLASATSSASTKLFHGGLRYLEFLEFRLVREALKEREVLLRAMPHISWPLRFVLPYHADMRFDGDTPVSRTLARLLPWMRGRRPAWLLRVGLFLYDTLGGRHILPGTTTLDLSRDPAGTPLRDEFRRAFEYSDCWVEDSRLVVLNARDAQARGARILTRCAVTEALREDGLWRITTQDARTGRVETHRARLLVNAGGPWAGRILREVAHQNSRQNVRLVRGSHIVTRRLFDHDRAYFLQGDDGRIVFAIPYEGDFTLIGTTDVDHTDLDAPPVCTDAEADYLCTFVSRYFRRPVTRDDIVWRYSGVRPLYDDGASSATAATRDYVLVLDRPGEDAAPLLSVFGGKITTYRRLAEQALGKVAEVFGDIGQDWTAGVSLPGGDFAVDGFDAEVEALRAAHPFLDPAWARRLLRAYGTEAAQMLAGTTDRDDLGTDFGATLTAREVDWLVQNEFARTAEDVIWRRSRLGLRLDRAQVARVRDYLEGDADSTGAQNL